ncbi:unnamed protein product [Camellia sinensis]
METPEVGVKNLGDSSPLMQSKGYQDVKSIGASVDQSIDVAGICNEAATLDQEDMVIDESNSGEPWVQGLMEGKYSDLSVEERLSAVVALIGVANEGNSICIILEECLEAANAIKKQMWAEVQLDKCRMKEESDLLILKTIKQSVEPRNSVCHSATIYANAIMHARTTVDTFLHENLHLEAVNFVRNQLLQHRDVQALGRAALDRRSQDNVSIIIVDLGACGNIVGGTGFTTLGIIRRMDAKNVTILDQSPHQLAKAKQKEALKECKIVEGDAEDLPFGTDYADRYVSAGSIEYWPDPQRGIKEAYRVLKLGGKACLIGPVYPTFSLSRFFADVWMLFPKEEKYIEWFEKAGFKDVQLKSIGPKWYRGVRRHGLIMGCSVTGVESASGDSPLQFLSLCTNKKIVQNVLRARESGKGVLTAPFRLLKSNRLGVILTFAVYKTDLPSNATSSERIQATDGYLGGVFNIESNVEKLLQQLASKQTILVNVYDTTNFSHPISMYGLNVSNDRLQHVSTLNFGDPFRKHEMRCRFKQKPPCPWFAMMISIGILVIALLLGHIINATVNQIAKVEDDYHEMMELKKRAEAADFLATVSHEIRTPMNGVLGMLQMLMDTDLDVTQQDYVRFAQGSGRALVSLINKLLDQAKIESSKLELEIYRDI